jgi:hypothetical protein
MIVLIDKETGDLIGEVTGRELQMLIDAFEEEGRDDRDYYIDATSPDYLQSNFDGAERLAGMLRAAMKGREGFDLQWERRHDPKGRD